jgi:hypothetical protein
MSRGSLTRRVPNTSARQQARLAENQHLLEKAVFHLPLHPATVADLMTAARALGIGRTKAIPTRR